MLGIFRRFLGIGIFPVQAGPPPVPPPASYFLRPDGLSFYRRPGGVDRFIRP